MTSLYAHQQKIIDANPQKCGLFLGTGSGKTRIALMLAKGEVLVICPKTQREDRNWEREYLKIVNDRMERYAKGQKAKTFKPRLTVISKEEFRRDSALIPRFDTVIVDEAHTCLGVTPNTRQRMRQTIPRASQIFEALDAYLERTKPARLYLCTATIVKSPMTVWAARKLLGKITVDIMSSFYRWRDTFYVRLPMSGREVYVARSDDETKDLLAKYVKEMGFVGRLEDYFDVPEQTFRTIPIELTKAQKDRIKDIYLEYPDPIVAIGKKHQIENGVLNGDEFSAFEEFPNNKIQKILELAEEFPRMVVFAKYTGQIAQLAAALRKEEKKVFILTGDTKDRGALLAEASQAKEGIFIAQAQISAGWQLKEYPVMVFASRTYSFVDYQQGIGRIQRADHIKKNLYINLVVKGGVDEAVDKALANKQSFDERLYIQV